ncbi:hypothetical protein REPUB_Repub17cG0091600 [Reevesia pubescens]
MGWSQRPKLHLGTHQPSPMPKLHYRKLVQPFIYMRSQLDSVVQSSPQCLCSVLNSGASLGITINQTLALQLPGACQVQTPPINRCNATPPAASPTGSPSDPSDETPEVPLHHQHQISLQEQDLKLSHQ